jgi:hypothetical protein
MIKTSFALIMIVFMTSGCEEKYHYDGCHEPILISQKVLREEYPKIQEGKAIAKAAKIYNYKDGDILLINERNKGIHVVDNRIKHRVTKSDYFINIPGNVDMAVKDGYLYADSFSDLVVFDIHDISNIKIVSRKESVFMLDTKQASRDYEIKNKCYMSDKDLEGKFIIGYKE